MNKEIAELCGRVIKLDAEATKGPLGWQRFGEWALCGQYGMRPIVLDAGRGKLRLRDHAKCLMIDFDPKHPDAVALAEYRTAAPALAKALLEADSAREELVEALERLMLDEAVEYEGRVDASCGFSVDALHAARKVLAAYRNKP